MSTTDSAAVAPQTTLRATRSMRDVRGFWRILMALIAPAPMLAKGLYYLLSPVDGDAPFGATVAAYQADPGRMELLGWLDVVFGALLVPATVALAWAARRGAPRLTTFGALLSVPSFSVAFFMLAGPQPAMLTVKYGLDPALVDPLTQAAENDPALLIVGVLFLVGIVFGLPVLGVALWRSRAASIWFGGAIVLGAGTHPFVPGHLGQGIGLLLAALGFAGVSLALLRTTNDAFDLPPVVQGNGSSTPARPEPGEPLNMSDQARSVR